MLNQISFLIISCICVLSLYFILNILLKFSPEYNNLNYNKQIYVLKNITKSIVLFIITFYSIDTILIPAYHNNWNNQYSYIFGSAYVSNDLIGLLLVPKLPFSTKMHHIITTSLLFYSYSIDFREDNVGRWMFIYTLMSTYSFLVNTYLGLRHIRTKEVSKLNFIIDHIRVLAFYIYLIVCVINWVIHLYLMIHKIYNYEFTISYLMYGLLLSPIINDDLILLNWLYKNVNN